MTVDHDALGALLHHRFDDPSLLERAVTHPSYANEHDSAGDYQRLEFLGDSVVGLCTTRLLFLNFPDLAEGDLSDLRQKVVSTKALGEVGRGVGLDAHVRLGGSERTKHQVSKRIVGDVVEALFGALLLDAGLPACRALADRWLAPRLEALGAARDDGDLRNAVNRLQEHTQARGGVVPAYAYVEDGPAHDLRFVATVSVGDEVLATGQGRRKKEAAQRAANLALKVLLDREPA